MSPSKNDAGSEPREEQPAVAPDRPTRHPHGDPLLAEFPLALP